METKTSKAAALLASARTQAGLTQAELARRAGIPRSVLNAYERGQRQPGADALVHILWAAGFEVRAVSKIDVNRNAVILSQVLDLAEKLPWRPRKRLAFPPMRLL